LTEYVFRLNNNIFFTRRSDSAASRLA